MPTGIVMQSGSIGAKPEDAQKVLEAHGYEIAQPATETPAEAVEPKREDFQSDEEFEAAQSEFDEKQEADARAKEEEEERKATAAQPHQTRIQKKIAKATAKLEKQLREANDRIAALEGKGKSATATAAEKPPEAPKREAFKTDEEFQEALFDYRYKLRRAKEDAESTANALADYQKKQLSHYVAAKDEIKEEYTDWDDTMDEFGESPVAPSVYTTILGLEEGPRVAYYLAKHPDKLEELNAMFPDQAMREVVRLHDRLKTKSAPSEKQTAHRTIPPKRLPAPVKPLAASATASTATTRDAKTFAEFKRARRAAAQ